MIAPNTGLIKDITNNKGDTTSSEENGTGKDVISAGGDSMRRNSECSDMRLYPGILSMTGRALCMLTCIPCIGSLLYGMDFGLTAWLLVNIEIHAIDGVRWFEIVGDSNFGRGLVGCSSPLGMALGCLLATSFAEKVGRKGLLFVAASCYFLGSMITVISGDLKWNHVGGLCLLLIGRVLYGLANAFTVISVPAYISETLPSRMRGTMLSCMELFIVVGIAVGFWMGGLAPFMVPRGWRYYFSLPMILGILMFIGVFYLPRSPRWLIMNKGTVEEIAKALSFVNPEATEDDARSLIWEIRRNADAGKSPPFFEQVKKEGAVAIAWKVSLLLIAFQQLTGQHALLYYSGLIFSSSLCYGNISWALNLIGITKLAGALACSFLVEEIGRRRLILGSVSGMALGMFLLSFDGFTKLIQSSAAATPICIGVLVLAFYMYIFSYSLGMGPVTWILLGEIYPVDVKAEATSYTLFFGCSLNVLVTLLVPIGVKFMTFLGIFILLFFICSVCFFVMYFIIPETKGKTLEEIQMQLETVSLEARKRFSSDGESSQRVHSQSFHVSSQTSTMYGGDEEEEKLSRKRIQTYNSSFHSEQFDMKEDSPLLGDCGAREMV
mmetsp:Transcript_38660/g.50939  ORF Transcript_38660/g.50939 Transcript_38660/m.50939 type:complete len:608 (+) Transcript_38660:53-1876(+)